MIKVLELKGLKSLRALNAFHTLILGLKMLPAYAGERYEDFLARVESMPIEDREKVIREAVLFVELQKDEVEAVLSFCADKNGVPYSAENQRNLNPAELVACIVAVCMRISEITINLVNDSEKKKLETSR